MRPNRVKMSAQPFGKRRGLLFGAALIFAACGGAAEAKCQDGPGPGVDWAGCSKARLMLNGEDLSDANFKRSLLTLSDFAGSRMLGADLSETEISRTRFEKSDLSKADFTKALGWRANFAGAVLVEANFASSDMNRSNFAQAQALGANFQKAELNRSDFSGANLERATMTKAELARVIFQHAKLTGVDFSFSNLSRAQLQGAVLQDVIMTGSYLYLTQLAGVDLSAVKGLTQAQIDIACGDAQTRLPTGLTPPKTWPCGSDDD
ncbi:pentapeptide repeat-containing protein [Microvirga makkahensis]|uniref:Pentapeptide repeat-containing protein n=1 Tax=Microvirga makkahensis TaxID=1128670 RepID=A0A7X3SQ77_9HYPH|nr:pentapeptide repeat-containing protein [Microvirga makkahensis]MXQ13202.1 pentapeptide repeat-containing protein [Microvirga makkahensis]